MKASVMQTNKPEKPDELAVDKSVTKRIVARKFWNDTGIRLGSGQEYHFSAVGRWIDLCVLCDADGVPSPDRLALSFEPLRRVPHEHWFTLIGAIDRKPETQFRIGKERTVIAPVTGVFTCFAKDVRHSYWNNFGSVKLTVTRIN